jgi:hypothetical protein
MRHASHFDADSKQSYFKATLAILALAPDMIALANVQQRLLNLRKGYAAVPYRQRRHDVQSCRN